MEESVSVVESGTDDERRPTQTEGGRINCRSQWEAWHTCHMIKGSVLGGSS